METEAFIRSLASSAQPVRRLQPPAWRAVVWFTISLAYAGLIAFFMGLRPDFHAEMAEPRFLIEIGACLLSSMMAAAAAFCAGCPGRPLWERFAPLPFVAIWLASLGEGCWQDWIRSGAGGFHIESDLICLPIIFAIGLVPGVLIFAMIRRGAPIAPYSTTGLAALAAAALAAAALRLTHIPDTSAMVLVWQFGSVAVLSALAAIFGRQLLRWPKRGDITKLA